MGVLIVIFVGVGISAFYPAPDSPDYPTNATYYEAKEPTEEQIASQKKFDEENKAYMENMKPYNRNVSIMTLAASVILLVISMVYEKKISILADGVMMGGLFALIYSIGRGFASEDNKYVFMTVSIGLAVAFYLGYRRFVKPQSKNKKVANSNNKRPN